MSARSENRCLRFGTSCLLRAPAVLAFCFAIAAVAFPARSAETTSITSDTRPDVVSAELSALRHRLSHAYTLVCEGTGDVNEVIRRRDAFDQEQRNALPQLERYLGLYHIEVLQCYRSLAIHLTEKGKYQEALGFARKEYERWKKSRGIFDPHTKESRKRVKHLEQKLNGEPEGMDAVYEFISDALADTTSILSRNSLIIIPMTIALGFGLWWVSKKR